MENGGLIQLAPHGHVDWLFGAGAIACFVEERLDLLETLLQPSEVQIGRALSRTHPSGYENAANYIRAVAEAAPQSMERILDAVDVP